MGCSRSGPVRARAGRSLTAVLLVAWVSAAAAQQPLEVELQAPDSVRPLLERHVRLLAKEDVTLPEAVADQSAMARRTRREVADLLATEGYFSAEVSFDRTETGRWTLKVEPGRQSKIAAVDIVFEGEIAQGRGDEDAFVDALRADWGLSTGEPFRQAAWDGAKRRLIESVSAQRYAAARIVRSRAEVDADAASVRLAVTIDSGPTFYLGPLQVSGLRELPADLVERYSTLRVGAPYDRDALLVFQSGLQNTPYFASVIVDIERDPALAAAVPVRVQVSEALPKRVGFGVGLSTNTGYRVETNYRDLNILDRGWEFSTGLRIEQKRQAAYADVFLPPEKAGHRYSFGALIDRSDLEGLKIDSQAIGVARSRVRGNIETQIALRLQHEKLQPDGAAVRTQNALTANWTWIQREVNDLLDPRDGHVLEFQIGGGAAIALADQDFVRLYSRYVHYQPVGERDVFIVRAEGGVTLAPSRDGIPQDFLFRTGGSLTVRGYGYQSLGVREGDAVVGGRYLGVASAEYVHWFKPDWGAAVFVDTGDAADTREEFELRTGYGIGARWRSPAGPLAIDLGYGHRDRNLQLHFGVAIAF